MNVAIFWDIAPRGLYVDRRFGGTYQLRLQGGKSAEQKLAYRMSTCYTLIFDFG
jgi:hypothetical protein